MGIGAEVESPVPVVLTALSKLGRDGELDADVDIVEVVVCTVGWMDVVS